MHRIREALQTMEGFRLFTLYGPGVSDLHFDSNNGEQGFGIAVERALLEHGFRSLFVSTNRRPFSHLTENKQYFEPYQITQSPRVLLDTQLRSMKSGPFGERFLLGDSFPLPQSLQQIGDDHVIRIFDELITKNLNSPVCLVILEAEKYLTYFEDQKTLTGLINKWNQLPSTNKNKVLFCINSDTDEVLKNSLEAIDIPYFENLLVHPASDQSSVSPLRRIGVPGLVEIEEYLSYPGNHSSFQGSKADRRLVARKIIRENQPFSYWLETLRKIRPLTIQSFKLIDHERNPHQPVASATERLCSMVGLINVKKKLDDLCLWANSHREANQPIPSILLNMVFSGPPGVGKTTVAKLMGEILFEAGLLDRGQTIERNPTNLISDHVGGTARLVNSAVDQAIGGVLFIDEAYGLGDRDRGGFVQEAVDTLLSRMDTDQGKFVLILAGYNRQMIRLFRQNPGLDRRFPTEYRFNLPSYAVEELLKLIENNITQSEFDISVELWDELGSLLARLSSDTEANFGNARDMINLADSLRRNWINRNSSHPDATRILEFTDLPEDYLNLIKPDTIATQKALDRVDQMKGLFEVKSSLKRMVHRVEYELHRRKNTANTSWSMPNLHQVFLGNPGTGKTTVARAYGELLHNAGYLMKGHTIEINAPTLISNYIGESTRALQNYILEALDGVLFIDEAYALARGNGSQLSAPSYEVIDTLVKSMEDNRNRLVVVVAGYPLEMQNFLDSNPGLASRFSEPLQFADLNEDDLRALLVEYSEIEDYVLPETVARTAVARLTLEQAASTSHFGNARSVRRLYEEMKNRLAARIMTTARANLVQNIWDIEGWNCFSMDELCNENVQVVIASDLTQRTDRASPPMLNWVVRKDS